MSAPDVEAIRARAEAATDGPWETVPTVGNAVVSPDGDGYWSDVADRIETEADAEFIAHAREDIPALLREIERLQAGRDAQGRFLSVVDEFARTTGMSPREVMGVVGVKADADRLAATVERVRRALSNHPHCDIHPGDDPITCGWKQAVLNVQDAIERTDS